MKLSIITATFNSEKTLRRCLDSVACQTRLSDIEHIIIDGRSTDKTLQLAAQYPHIETILSAKDRGIYDAFNKGISQATGDLVYFLNSDDELIGSDIADFIISQFKDAVMFLSGAVYCIEAARSFVAREYQPDEPKSKPRHQGFVCRREVFEEVGGFNECLTIAADMYFMKKVVRNYEGVCTDKLIAKFHLGGVSSQIDNRQNVIAQDKIVEYLLGDPAALDANIADASIHTQNNLYLKKIFKLFLNEQLDFSAMKGKNIAIFGTRGLSEIISGIGRHCDLQVNYFLVSNSSESLINSTFPCYSLNSNFDKEPDYVINCIEGGHREKISQSISKRLPSARILNWFEIDKV
ncbi:glycosyltransferase [Salinimonas marina]|uniref:Glycosyltransferase n=1 Tax=Salinimonas marina TaxID=2785918 RepID=A0A7S9HCJ8_9ALTE|nr:glycosyltransferase [Salinimonas marina]QPG04957.1 glycosyltransferase [Salinimonas marina]